MFNFLKSFKKSQLNSEAFFAYFHRLPEKIQVEWFRDEGYIIGKVMTGEGEFMTQARSSEQFVDMVNDLLYCVYDIPEQYRDAISKVRAYQPSDHELEKLQNVSVSSSVFGSMRTSDQRMKQLA